MLRGAALAVLATAMLGPLTGTAGAATFCVYGPAACPLDGIVKATAQVAMTTASGLPGDDVVLIGPGDHVDSAVQASGDTDRIEVAGSGVGVTTLRVTATGAGVGLANALGLVRDLSIRAEDNVGYYGVGTVRRLDVVATGSIARGIEAGTVLAPPAPLTVEDSTIDVSAVTTDAIGVFAAPAQAIPALTIRDSVIRGGPGEPAVALKGVATVERTRVTSPGYALSAAEGTTTVTDSLLVSGGEGEPAVVVFPTTAAAVPLTVTGSTIVSSTPSGPGHLSGIGLQYWGTTAGGLATVTNTAIRTGAGGRSISLKPAATGVPPAVDIAHSDFDPAAVFIGPGVGGTVGGLANQWSPDARFVDEAGGDYRLRFDSPLVDKGVALAGLGPFDRAGLPRSVGGIPDIGAFEYQAGGPSVTVTGTGGVAGAPATFAANGSDPDPGEGAELTYAWRFDDGGTAAGAVVAHPFATPGSHSGTVTVTDPTGRTATARADVTATSPPGAPGPGTPSGRTAAPRLTLPRSLSVAHGVTKVRLACAPGASCAGRLTLLLPERGRPRRAASAPFRIQAGATATISLRLKRAAALRLRRGRAVRARLVADLGGGRTVTRTTQLTRRS